MWFANKVVIITGASSGIGHALARELVRRGAKVGLLARRLPMLESLAADIASLGGTAAFEQADILDRQATVAAIHRLRDRLGPVDLLVANAGVGLPTPLDPQN